LQNLVGIKILVWIRTCIFKVPLKAYDGEGVPRAENKKKHWEKSIYIKTLNVHS